MSAEQDGDLQQNLAELRTESLRIVAVTVGLVSYGWLFVLIYPVFGGRPPPAIVYVGCVAMLMAATVAFFLADRCAHLGALCVITGQWVAIACAAAGYRIPELTYLFVAPVIFSSVLMGGGAVFFVALAAAGVVDYVADRTMGFATLTGTQQVLPIIVLAVVSFASWLSLRNLNRALQWAWHSYERARRNEDRALDVQGQLRRVLKAMDEAQYRLERANYMLAVARDQATEAQRLKQRFAQNISHELRTPLNLIVGFTELMSESPEYYGGPLPPAYLRDLSIIHRNACHLQGLVNDVLELSRIEAAQVGMTWEHTAPATLIADVVDTARPLVESRHLHLETSVEPALPTLLVDPTRIRQVLLNLVTNAVRFTERGGITLRAGRRDGEVIFSVTDTGTGVPEEHLSRIFDEFHQVQSGGARGGAGLGLSISKSFVELHGGRIWVESQAGCGSTFFFTIPVTRDAVSGEAWASNGPPPATRERPVILVVTRSPLGAALLARRVPEAHTVISPDLGQAQTIAREWLPHVVVVDQAGPQTAPAELAELAQLQVPVLRCCLPGEQLMQDRLQVTGYLIKPVTRESTWDVLRGLGEKIESILVVDDDQDFVLFMSRLLENNPVRQYRVFTAHNGREAMTLAEHHRPDLILLDLGLPDIGGEEVIAQLRANEALQADSYEPAIVVVSGQDALDQREMLPGELVVSQADGVRPGELLSWLRGVIICRITPSPVPPER
jgi:signal transduction histidine kinase/CheY-like chemotaxis protein